MVSPRTTQRARRRGGGGGDEDEDVGGEDRDGEREDEGEALAAGGQGVEKGEEEGEGGEGEELEVEDVLPGGDACALRAEEGEDAIEQEEKPAEGPELQAPPLPFAIHHGEEQEEEGQHGQVEQSILHSPSRPRLGLSGVSAGVRNTLGLWFIYFQADRRWRPLMR